MKTLLCLLLVLDAVAAFAADSDKPYVVGSLGDSISAGFNSYRLGDNRNLNWSTGLDHQVLSHAKRLAAIVGRRVEVHNEAFVGAVSKDLPREVERLVRYKPDYVTILIGANDLCNWTGNYEAEFAAFDQRLNATIQRLVTVNPNVRIVLASLPNIVHAYQIGKAHNCQSRWNSIGLCQPLFNPGLTDQDREDFGKRFLRINDVIKDVGSRFPANVAYKPELANSEYPWEFLSFIDCFHPSLLGHSKIAELTFDPSWH